MREILTTFPERFGKLLIRVGKHLIESRKPQSERRNAIRRWLADQGDKSHRMNYPLDETSLVMDVGGYEGQWASDIYSMYGCTIHIFEPTPNFADGIAHRFARNSKIFLHRFGLSNRDQKGVIYQNRDGTSLYGTGEAHEIELVSVQSFLLHAEIKNVDLIKINIEGAEYDLLDHLLETGLVTNFRNLQIQFHEFMPDAKNRMVSIQKRLRKTHILTYQYEFVWENWHLKE